jgi:glycosyltransferase involved in cell wall biosynthesis
MRTKAVTIYQSCSAPAAPLPPPVALLPEAFVVCVLAHLRDVKDPLLTAHAVAELPASSRIQVLHLGGAGDDAMRRQAEDQAARNPRWHWLGNRPRNEALRILAGGHLLALTSVREGGANAVTEAIACGIPVVSTRIDGSIGILGEDYPGYTAVGDAAELASVLHRVETDATFHALLKSRCQALRPLTLPAHEEQSWRALLESVCGPIEVRV